MDKSHAPVAMSAETSGAAAPHASGHRAGAHLRVGDRDDRSCRALEAHADWLVPGVLHRIHPADGPEHDHRQPAAEGHRHLGQQRTRRLGLRHHQLRLVDRHRPRRNADLGDSAPLPPAVADVDQPLRRGDDALCRCVRGDVPAAAYRPTVAGYLLAVPVPEHDGPVAAVPQSADLGRVCGLDLRHGVGAVLVHRTRPRHGHAARSREVSVRAAHLRHAGARMARVGQALAALRNRVPAARRHLDPAGALRSLGGELRLRGLGRCRAGTRRSSRPTSSPARSTPASRW